jgi:hypothetical protein
LVAGIYIGYTHGWPATGVVYYLEDEDEDLRLYDATMAVKLTNERVHVERLRLQVLPSRKGQELLRQSLAPVSQALAAEVKLALIIRRTFRVVSEL